MHLYVVRHGIAEPAQPGGDDASRALTDEGERKLRRAVQGLRELDVSFDRVLTSPWARALRTAELLAPVSEAPPVATEALCEPPRPELLALIAETGDQVAVVGHEPWLGELIAWLVFGDPKHGDAILLKKGGVAWLDGRAVPGGMKLRAIYPPKLLRALR